MSSEEGVRSGGDGGSVRARLEAVWREVLRVQAVGPDETFLDLGGESVSGTLLTNRIQAVFGVEVLLEVLLGEDATVATLAAYIEATREPGGQG